MDKLSQTQNYIQKSTHNDWQLANLTANVLKFELLHKLDESGISSAELKSLKQQAKLLNSGNNLIRLDLLELNSLSFHDNTKVTVTKQLYLLEEAVKIEDKRLAADIYSEVGRSQIVLSNWTGAILSLNKAHDLYLQSNDLEGLGGVLNMLGSINISLKNFESAVKYFQEAIDIANKQGDVFRASIIYYNIGEAYFESKDLVEALRNHEAALALSVSLKDESGIAYSQAALADIFAVNEEWQTAIELYKKSYEKFVETGNYRRQVVILIGLSKCYLGLKDDVRAMQTIEKIAMLLANLDDPYNQVKYNAVLADALFLQGEHALAFETLKKNVQLMSELKILEQEKEIQKYKVQFESQLTEEQNAALRMQNQLNSLTIEQQKKQANIWLLVIALTVVLLLFMLWILMTKIKHSNRFKAMAFVDPLTSSPNRRYILEHAKRIFDNAQQDEKNTLTIAIIDIDKFKVINDKFGHNTGDNVLKAFAQVCKENLRGTDAFGRYGGEEWLIVFQHGSQGAIKSAFERLREALNSQLIIGLPDSENVTFSMGVAQFDPNTDISLQGLISRADENLYMAKERGRNQLVC
ncbi:GGDEF domain-containing protein [Flavobacterium sp. W21_SRS_FM6]|uniref:GGDEF domain-containing protein n=1 Tax=Flavobacterium sp. W21_SRS_FM6 TaxID=3240268 RepID=UPI003F93EEC6